MNQFLSEFGIDWKLFLSQLVNFALILIILQLFVYKPLVKVLNERRKLIERGLAKAKEADEKMEHVHEYQKKKIQEIEGVAVAMMSKAEAEKKRLEAEAVVSAKEKEEELVKKAELVAESKKQEIYANLQKEAGRLMKQALAKAIDEDPSNIDDILIEKAVSQLKHEL